MYSLINQLQKKDEQALREVINKYGGYVKAIVVKVLQHKPKTVELLSSISNSKDLPERIVEQKVQKEQLFISILNLSKNDQEIFLLKYYLGYSNGEIAEIFGLSKSAVENRLYRGKLKLTEELGGI